MMEERTIIILFLLVMHPLKPPCMGLAYAVLLQPTMTKLHRRKLGPKAVTLLLKLGAKVKLIPNTLSPLNTRPTVL